MISNKVKLIQTLSLSQWRWLWSAYWHLWPTLLKIKFMPAAWLRKKIELSPSKESLKQTESTIAIDMHKAVRLAARLHFIEAACLPRSLVLVQMLKNRKMTALLRIGVAKTANGIASHAWVELDGEMVGEPERVGVDFTVLNSDT